MFDLSLVEAMQVYAQQFHPELTERTFFGAESLEEMTVIDNVKGDITLTDLEIGDISKRANLQFDPSPNVFKFIPRKLSTVASDQDLEVNPNVFERTYLEYMRSKGQNNKDIPFAGRILGGIAVKTMNEIEHFIWQGKEKTQNITSRDPLRELADGFIEKAKKLRAEGYPPISVPGGAYTTDNFLPWLDDVSEEFSDEAALNGMIGYCSRKTLTTYINAYKKHNNQNMPETLRYQNGVVHSAMLPNGMGWLKTKPGFGSSKLVLFTCLGNLAYGTDDRSDFSALKIMETIKTIQYTNRYRIGVEFRIADEGFLIMNDLN